MVIQPYQGSLKYLSFLKISQLLCFIHYFYMLYYNSAC